MSTSIVNLDVDQYVRINQGLNPMILQAHRDSVHIAFSPVKPAKENTAIHILSEVDRPFTVAITDENVWALATTPTASLTITEFNTPGDANIITLNELAEMLVLQLSSLVEHSQQNIKQLKLLNMRVEEAFNTNINIEDV